MRIVCNCYLCMCVYARAQRAVLYYMHQILFQPSEIRLVFMLYERFKTYVCEVIIII